jgi:carboxyl-terminal processing protease
VQNVIQLEGGRSALKLTTASYQRPSGKNIHRFKNAKEEDEWGVMPNEGYVVKYDVDELRNYFKNRRDRDVVRNGDAAPQNGEEPDAKFIDRQMSKALEYLTGQLAKAN